MSNKATADVSIIVPNYNNGRFLTEFIDSVINSTVWPRELIIVDDGSTDDSLVVLNQYKKLEFLKVLKFSANLGLTDALNAGLNASASKYIMRADPDDMLYPERIERQVLFMEHHPETDVLGCNVWYFHHDTGRNVNMSNFPVTHSEILKAYRRGEHGIQHPTAFMKRRVAERYRYQKLFPGEDYEFFSSMARDGCRFANLPEPLYRMRVHPASSTSTLQYISIKNTFKIKDAIWETHTSEIRMYLYYFFIRFYRRYQISNHVISKYLFLALAVLCYPKKLVGRIISIFQTNQFSDSLHTSGSESIK